MVATPRMPGNYPAGSVLSTSSPAQALRWARIARAEMASGDIPAAVYAMSIASGYSGQAEGEWLAEAKRTSLRHMRVARGAVEALCHDLCAAVHKALLSGPKRIVEWMREASRSPYVSMADGKCIADVADSVESIFGEGSS